MSGINSDITVPVQGEDVTPSAIELLMIGGIFESVPATVADGKTKRVRIKNDGSVIIATDATDPLDVALPADAATETTLNALLTAFNAEDFATQTTLAVIAAKDFATETTLSALNSAFAAEDFASETTLSALNSAFAAEDFASETTLSALSAKVITDVVDLPDSNYIDASSTAIPASASLPLEVVASLSSNVKGIQFLDTTGEYIGVYTGAAAAEVLKCVIGPGSDSYIPVTISSGTRISVRNLKNAAINAGDLSMNFFG